MFLVCAFFVCGGSGCFFTLPHIHRLRIRPFLIFYLRCIYRDVCITSTGRTEVLCSCPDNALFPLEILTVPRFCAGQMYYFDRIRTKIIIEMINKSVVSLTAAAVCVIFNTSENAILFTSNGGYVMLFLVFFPKLVLFWSGT